MLDALTGSSSKLDGRDCICSFYKAFALEVLIGGKAPLVGDFFLSKVIS
jgi:hypothetical protein